MARVSLDDVLAATGGRVVSPGSNEGVDFTGVSIDSRTARAGDLFFALKGERHDGHDFVAAPAARGAAAAVVSRPPAAVAGAPACLLIQVEETLEAMGRIAAAHRAGFSIPVIAVTGSVGKTTTKEMAAQILSQRFKVLKTQENYNNEIGVPLTALQLEAWHEAAVFELAMRGAGEIAYLTRIVRPTVGVVTNIGVTHIERLGSVEAIAAAKGELLDEMGADSVAVLNADDGNSASLSSRAHGQVVTFGVSGGADFAARDLCVDETGAARFHLVAPAGGIAVRLVVRGRHNVSNALAAAAAATQAGCGLDDLAAGLESAAPGKHRLQVINSPRGFAVLDDCYNANPDSMIAALEVLASMSAQRRIAVLGDMLELGPQAAEMHRRVGREAGVRGLALLVTAGEFAQSLCEGAATVMSRGAIVVAGSAQDCADVALREARPGDVILVKASRAMAFEQVVERLAGG